MKRLIPMIALIPISGCQQAMVAKRAVDTVFAEGVSLYCRAPESVRLANRARIAAKIHPNSIEIHCASDSGTGG